MQVKMMENPERTVGNNIVGDGISNIDRDVRIGDKDYFPEEVYYRKNIGEDNVEDTEEFTLGDGH